jgi:predicted PurR-regulated permease PerM
MASNNRFYVLALFFLAAVLGYLTYEILKPFLSPIAWAIVLSTVFYPLYVFIQRFVKLKTLASLISILVILVVILGPFSYLTYVLTQELMSLSDYLQSSSSDPLKSIMQHELVGKAIYKGLSVFHMTEKEFMKTVADNVSALGKQAVGMIRGGLSNVISGFISFIFMILTIFFLFTDGPNLLEKISMYMPFSKTQRERLIKQTRDIVVSTIYGGVTVAVIQGLIGGITFAILGISSPVVWGLAICITSFIPLVGTFLIWGPAAAYLAFGGAIWKGIALVIVGVAGISSVDNFLRPLIIRDRVKMPLLAIFFGIFGGIQLFGFVGFIMGPLVLALFISMIQILRHMDEEPQQEQAKHE